MKKWFVVMCCIFFLLLCSCDSDEDVILQEETDEAAEAQTEDDGTRSEARGDETAADAASGEQASAGSDRTKESPVICVYICGAVVRPGVYTLPAGGRVYELLEMAGGFAADADERSVNLAQPLEDGAMVFLPTVAESEAGVDASAYAATDFTGDAIGGTDTAEEKVNINTADVDALTTLNGIGEAKAAAIVAYREEHSGFQSLEELMEVSGIGEKTYDKIKDDITL